MVTNALEIYATEHVYNNAGNISRIVRIAPCYHRLVSLFTAEPNQYKREIWYRPNLEPFDQNYNAKHAHKVSSLPFADLVINNEPWQCNTIQGDAIITVETLYFPNLIKQLVQASHNGTRVFCVNHFYPIAE